MRILAIETSGREASLAALEGGDERAAPRLVRAVDAAGSERTAQALAPRLQELLAEIAWPVGSIQLVVVAVGPGSFTGLRIGVTTAKTLAYAIGAEVIGVNTLSAIAEQAPRTASPLWVVMDAQRQELFAAQFSGDSRAMISETSVVAQSDWIAGLRASDDVTGPGLRRLASALPAEVQVVNEALWRPMAEAVGIVGWREYQAGRRDDVWKLLPQYYRQSAAEEKEKQTRRQGDRETGR